MDSPSTPTSAREALRQELDGLRSAAGSPSYRRLSEAIDHEYSHTTVAQAFGGNRLPAWRVYELLAEALSGDVPRIRLLWDKAAEARGEASDDAHALVLKRYLERVSSVTSRLHPPDFDRLAVSALQDQYVEPTINVISSLNGARSDGREVPIEEVLSTFPRAVLLGDAGSGKTAACEYLAQLATRSRQQSSASKLGVPFMVRLGRFSASPSTPLVKLIRNEIEGRLQLPIDEGFVPRILNNDSSMVLLDGLDEVMPDRARSDFAEAIEMFATQFPRAKILVTSRTVGYATGAMDRSVFAHLSLAPLDSSQRWELARRALRDANSAEEFMKQAEQMQETLSNPLLLSLAVVVYRSHGSLGQGLADLYERLVWEFTDAWDRRRGIGTGFASPHLSDALSEVAWRVVTSADGSNLVSESDLVLTLRSWLSEHEALPSDALDRAVQDLLAQMSGRAGVLVDSGPGPGGREWSFVHRGFLEYLAAVALVRRAASPTQLADWLCGHISDPRLVPVAAFATQLMNRVARDGSAKTLERLISIYDDSEDPARSGRAAIALKHLLPKIAVPTALEKRGRQITSSV